MKALRILCGIAVLLNSLHLIHAVQHFLSHQSNPGPAIWAGVAFAGIVDILGFIGGYLLIRSAR